PPRPADAPAAIRPTVAPPRPPAAPQAGEQPAGAPSGRLPSADGWKPQVSFTGGSAAAAARSVPTVRGESLATLRQVLPDGGMQVAVRLHQQNLQRRHRPPPPLERPQGEAARRLRDVLSLLERAEQAAPNAPQIEAQIALVQAALGDLPAAIGNMRRAAERQPSNPAFRAFLAILLDRAGQGAQAIPAYLEAQRLVLDADGWRVPLPATPAEMRQRVEVLVGPRR
ncbi:MAG: tetratricopeptide repeat protein, partial [Alphaproteobacteria bacterium]|nr:tetratricopeptide repeat protein [Alphaproteobacteria bacterium]